MDAETEEVSLTPVTGPVLLCTATRWEARPLAAFLGLKSAGAGRWEGALGEKTVVLVQTGVGRAKADEALLRLSKDIFGLALSVGFAGALQPGMKSGDVVCDVRGSEAGLPPLARGIAAKNDIGIHFGRIAHSDAVLASPDEKRALGAKERASAVDMETRSLREWAEDRQLAVLPVRVVLDSIYDRLPRAMPQGEDFASLVSYVLKNLADLPIMILTSLKQRKAAANLASFLKELIPNL